MKPPTKKQLIKLINQRQELGLPLNMLAVTCGECGDVMLVDGNKTIGVAVLSTGETAYLCDTCASKERARMGASGALENILSGGSYAEKT